MSAPRRTQLPAGFSVPTGRGIVTLRPVRLDADLELVHEWMNRPHVARFWRQDWSLGRIRGYLTELLADPGCRPMLGLLAGVPVSYWEIYRAAAAPVGATYPVHPADLGVHVLIGEVALTGRGLGRVLLGAVREGLFAADPACNRVVAEPDVRNTASVRAFQHAGFRHRGEIRLPDKVAALLVAERYDERPEPRPRERSDRGEYVGSEGNAA